MFIGRKAELAELERRYNQNGFQFPVIYGRRRVGKTRLIQEFISDKKSVYFMAARQTSSELLQGFSETIKEQFPDERTKFIKSFENWESLFSYITEVSRKTRIVLVIDEYWGKETIYNSFAFEGTHLNLATQAKLKQLGYNGKF